MSTEINSGVQRAITIALGEARNEQEDSAPYTIRAAHKDLNCKGNGDWWYRMVYRNGTWQYFSDERLPMGTFRAAERRATVHGDVYIGELVCSHDRGGPLDGMWLVVGKQESSDTVIVKLEHRKRRDGMVIVTLPDGQETVVPNPRNRS